MHKIAQLDIRMANTDRNGGNILACHGADEQWELVPVRSRWFSSRPAHRGHACLRATHCLVSSVESCQSLTSRPHAARVAVTM